MICQKNNSNQICDSLNASIDCVKTIYQGEEYQINIQLINKENYPLDLNDVLKIQIYLYDVRNIVIAKYIYPSGSDSFSSESYIGDEIWFNNLNIEILQITFNETFNTADLVLNKGKIAIKLTKDITNYLMIGNIVADIKIELNDFTTYNIDCLLIGVLNKNKFN